MSAFNHIINKAKENPKRIVLPEANDERVLKSAAECVARGIAKPILVGHEQMIKDKAKTLDISLNAIDIIDITHPERLARYQEMLLNLPKSRVNNAEQAQQELTNSMVFACLMLLSDEADGCVAGAVTATADVVRYALRLVGKQPEITEVSSFFIMLLNEQHPVKDVMLVADCALIIDPDSDTLASIAANTGESALKLLGLQPQVAMLSFSTDGSARHKSVSKVIEATALLREKKPHWRVVGEVQLDAAVMPHILASKSPQQATEEPCNVLIFPNLDAGNIGYKLIERFGEAQAIGPILQGLKKPVNDLSRGCKQSDIVNLIATTVVQSQ